VLGLEWELALIALSLVETQQLDKVDAIAGATVSYELFENVVGIALKQAKAE